MVFQKRLDYGSNGYQVPFVPRFARSVRKRKIFKRKAEDDQMCAFDLLATVAGKLLQEGEILPSPKSTAAVNGQLSIDKDTVKQEIQVQEKPLKVEPCDPGSCDESVFVSGLCFQVQKQNFGLEELQHSGNNVGLEQNSVIMSSACSEKARRPEAMVAAYRNEFLKSSGKQVCIKRDGESPCKQVCIKRDGESPHKQVCRKQDGESPRRGLPCKGNLVDGNMRRLDSELQNVDMGIVVNGSVPYSRSSMYPMELDIKSPALASSDSSVEVPMCSDKIPHSSFIPFRDDVKKVVSKDDDENSSGCTRPSTRNTKASRPPPRTGDRRIRKLLASKYRKAAPRLKDGELSHNELRPLFRNRRACYTRQRSERNFFKRRRMFERCSASPSEGGTSSDGFSNSSKMVIDGNSTGSASRSSSPATGQSPSSFHPRDSHVKLSIKSFRVPELFIDIPETATIGSLKRTVMEAVNAILGGGLHVGVVLQGKKVRDDNKTLLQTGIASDDKQGALGFTLEPNPAPAPVPQPLCPEDPPCIVPCSTPQPLASYTPPSTLDPAPSDTSLHPTLTNLGNFVESDRDSVPSQTNQSADISLGSRALVAIPTSVEALTVVPMHRKSRRSELAQRRIRRPFSVTEVEALVQAVEKLGTGRWRDVKLRAFDNAKHRTYVDLKDKWKTLVHTARISPQQRRGEPVPQELLDRVLAAHAYWSQQAAKQQVKQQNQQTTTEACLLL